MWKTRYDKLGTKHDKLETVSINVTLPQLKAAKVNVNCMTYLNPLLMRNDRVTRQADGFHVSLLELGSQFSHSTEFSCAYRSKVCGMGEENTPSENTITSYWRTNIFNALPVTCGSNKFINLWINTNLFLYFVIFILNCIRIPRKMDLVPIPVR